MCSSIFSLGWAVAVLTGSLLTSDYTGRAADVELALGAGLRGPPYDCKLTTMLLTKELIAPEKEAA
jgi:hypothetical protein